jgi:hypothetical protein
MRNHVAVPVIVIWDRGASSLSLGEGLRFRVAPSA